MYLRLRSFLFKLPVLIGLGLFLAYLLFGWFAFGPLAKWGAEKFVFDKSGHRLTLDEPKFDPLGLKIAISNLRLAEPDGKPLAGFKSLFVDFEASSLLRMAWTFDAIRLTGPEGRLTLLPGGTINWSAFLAAFKDDKKDDSGLPRLLIRHFELKDGRFGFSDQTLQPAFSTDFHPLELTLEALSTLPDDKGAYQIAARTALGARLRWHGDVRLNPVDVSGAFAVEGMQLDQLAPYLKGRLDIAKPEGQAGFSAGYRVAYANKKLSLSLDKLAASVDGLRLRGALAAKPALAVDTFTISGGRFDLAQKQLSLGKVSLTGGRVDLTRHANGRLDIQDWFVPAPATVGPAKEKTTASQPTPPWRISVPEFALDGVALAFADQSFATPLAMAVGNLSAGFKAEAEFGASAPQLRLAGGRVGLKLLTLVSAGKPWFSLDAIVLEDVAANLAETHVTAARLALDRGDLTVLRGADRRIALLDAFAPAGGRAAPAIRAAASNQGDGWTWRLERFEANDFKVTARDESVTPAAGLTLGDIDARLDGLTEKLGTPVPLQVGVAIKEGGRLKLDGKLTPAKGALDARLDVAGLSLLPAQPYIGQAANVILRSGTLASQGRLKVGERVSYQGGFKVDNLLVNESHTGDRLLAWQSLASDELSARPEAVDIGTVKVDGLGLKLVIDKDKVLNLKHLMKPQPATTPSSAPAPAEPGRAFKFAIERININANELDFADQSLALPFGTRIHGLKGAVNGIGLDKGKPAQLELDGLVDDYGLARAVGQIDLFDPTGFTDIKVIFRNVEMNRLTPYSATFAGRKIASGKLSLDLEYKIKQRQLQGDNNLVIDKITLGEPVETPGAKNLPLDLAIAILEDSNGVIDLGLPVSGSLDDPQFSYGGIIWKAIVNVIGKIVLAPFRALGKLLGVEGDKLEKVTFDLGEARLLPPEREKLKQLAQALAKRPGLALTVTPAWNPEGDRLAIKEARLLRALAEAAGRKLAPDEDPGPVSTAQPKTQDALEKLYSARVGADALKMLKAKFTQANPEPPPTSVTGKLLSRLSGLVKAKPEPLSEVERTQLKGANLHELIYQTLLDKEAVTDPQLAALAGERGGAIRAELLAQGVAADKLTVQAAEPVAGEAREVAVKLGLGVAPRKVP